MLTTWRDTLYVKKRVDTESDDAEDLLTRLNVKEDAQVRERRSHPSDGTVEVDGDIREIVCEQTERGLREIRARYRAEADLMRLTLGAFQTYVAVAVSGRRMQPIPTMNRFPWSIITRDEKD
jgi:hypothetical protein